MFVDKVKIYVKGGDGGKGMVAFRREKFVSHGGPAGGDGGKGGDVILRVDEGMRTLLDFRFQRHYKAKRGEDGRSKGQHGAGAIDSIIFVPPGTVIKDADNDITLADLTVNGQEISIATGGRGGKGNMRFATPVNPAPQIAENGEPGQEKWITLELKLLADVGLVGYPSVGKSTLLSVVSAAQPKIAAYHFTTLAPNLGVVNVGDGDSFVMADLPGLIEGAHQGVGLGHQFLRHIERTKILVHVIDMAGSEGRDPYDDWCQINEEIKLYQAGLEQRLQLVAANKMDLPDAVEKLTYFKEKINNTIPIFPISAATREGVQELIYAVADLLTKAESVEKEIVTEHETTIFYTKTDVEEAFTVRRENEMYVVEGERIEKLVKMTNFDYHDSILRFGRTLKRMGIEDALRKKGAVEGDNVQIGDRIFELTDKMYGS